ncbi:signal peptidase I [Christensenellaceae bacterium OttesenSCG-928-L17]|nr:signal peptidase I [Christensenellaceae bacterium OttesenSCG-928-L17]
MEAKLPLRSAYKQAEYKRQSVYAWLFILAQALLLIAALFFFLFTPVRVNGTSMAPTLHAGEILLIDKLSLFLRTPERGAMVIFEHPETEEELIKRVIAYAGETVQIQNGQVFIDGRLLSEDAYMPSAGAEDFGPVAVEAGCVFVLGDDRAQSVDSRAFGSIPLRLLDGRVRFRIAPINKAALYL